MQWNWSQQRTTVGHLKLFVLPSSRQTSIPYLKRAMDLHSTDVLNRIKPSHYVASLILRERVSLSLFPYLILILSLLSPFLFSFNIFFSWNRLNLSHRIWFKLWFWFWVWLWFWFWIRIRMRQLSNNQRDRLPGWELELIIVWLWLPVSVLRER